MFKSGRWKNQNSKIKVMFQLQFQATQVPKVKGKGLMIALIPADIGKPIARLEKAPVVDGTCTWEDPIYEMVKLVKNQKTETYKEKIYYFNVQTGSSKSGFVGEVGVDFANFAEANEPFQLSLPLTASDSGAILHVFIQKMQRTDEQREFEENESLQSESLRSKNQASDCSENRNILDFAGDDGLQAENNPIIQRKSKPLNKKGDGVRAENNVQQRSSTDWSLGSLSDRSMADLLNSPDHNYMDQTYTEASKNAVEVLKSEVSRLERQAELSDLELDSLRKQILKENKRGQDLLRKIDELKEEKEALDIESNENSKVVLDKIREELSYEKSLNKSLQESNSELLITMEEKDTEISYLSEKLKESQMVNEDHEAELELEKKEKEELKIHIDDITLDYKFVLQENDDMSSKLEETQIEQSKLLTKIKQYELQVKRLEEKIMNQTMELSQSLDTIEEYETHIKSLEKELEKQGHDFEDDVQDLMKAKIEQEERVIQAEEALRKSRLTNATVVEKLTTENQNLQQQIRDLQEELLLTKDAHKQEGQKLCDLTNQQAEQIKQMSLELETCKKHGENNSDVIKEKEILVTEFASLKKESSEKNVLIRSLQSELKMLRGDYNEVQQRLLVIESQKVNLQKEVSKLEQKHLKLLKESEVACDVTTSKHVEYRSILESAKSNEGRCSEKELSTPTSHYNDEQNLNKLLNEISSLDERNKHMESELKEMQEKYSEVSLRFAEVEGERQQLVMALRNLKNGKKK